MTDDNFAWTGTFPDGTTGGGEAQDCNAWTSDSASDNGDGGNTGQTSYGWTLGSQDSCSASHHVYCIQFE